jgi:hypothetical protein
LFLRHDPAFPQFATNLSGDLQDIMKELTLEVDAYKEKQKNLEGPLEGMLKQLNLK